MRGVFVRSKEASLLNAMVKDGGVERGLQALFTETERVARHGFTSTELDRQKTNMLRSYERMVAEKDNRQSSGLAAEYARAFTTREPIPGLLYESELAKRFVPEITLAEVNALAREWAPDGNRVVVISAPEKDGAAMPDQQKLAAIIKSVDVVEDRTVRRYGRQRAAARSAAGAWQGRVDVGEAAIRDHRMATEQRRSRGAQAHDVPRRRDSVPGVQSWRHVAGQRCGLHGRDYRDARRRTGGPGRVPGHRFAEGARWKSRIGPALYRWRIRRHGGQRLEEGPRDDVPAPASLVHEAAARRGTVRRRDDAVEGAVRESGEPAGVRPRAGTGENAVPEPCPRASVYRRARRRDEPRQVDGVLPRPVCRCQRLHVRLRRHLRHRWDPSARRALRRQPAVDEPERDLEGHRHPDPARA